MQYTLGPGDVLEVSIPELSGGTEYRPLRARVMGSGAIQLPLVDPVLVDGMTLIQAKHAIERAYAGGFINDPRVSVELVQPNQIDVLVLGEVGEPGTYPLAKFQNDVGHAIGAARGLTENADTVIEVHRRSRAAQPTSAIQRWDAGGPPAGAFQRILQIPLRGLPSSEVRQEDIVLGHGDVVVVPSRKHDVFFVVGELDDSNLVGFSLGDQERELSAGLMLPRDRDIDVMTAVAMSGYIDPINSPTTVTVHRTLPGGDPLLIRVDLIAARYDRQENV
jgi:protein involved in polysaccharide export with SLBB domain